MVTKKTKAKKQKKFQQRNYAVYLNTEISYKN